MSLEGCLLQKAAPQARTPISIAAGLVAPFVLVFLLIDGIAAEPLACCEDLINKLQAAERAGRIEEAHRWASLIIEHEKAVNPDGPLLPAALERLASLDQDEAQFDEAERLYQESISLCERQPKALSLELANSVNSLGSLYDATGKLKRAEALCRRALALRLAILGRTNVDVAISYSNLGVALLRQKKFQEAEANAQHALGIWRRLHSEQDRSAVDLNTLALVRLQQRDFQAATAFDKAAIQKCRESPPADRWSLISYLHTLAVIQWTAGQGPESVATFDQALNVLGAGSFPNLLEKCNLLTDYALVLRNIGQRKRAKTMDQQAKATRSEIFKRNPAQHYTVDMRALIPRP